MPVIRTQAANRLTQVVIQLSPLINPLIYCYRDHRFRNAILELLGMRIPQVTSSAGVTINLSGKRTHLGHRSCLKKENAVNVWKAQYPALKLMLYFLFIEHPV